MALSQAGTRLFESLVSQCFPCASATSTPFSQTASIAPGAVTPRRKIKGLGVVAKLGSADSPNKCHNWRQVSSSQQLFCSSRLTRTAPIVPEVSRGCKSGVSRAGETVSSLEKPDDVSNGDVSKEQKMGRRKVLELAALVTVVGNLAVGASPAQAYTPPPEGFRRYTDRLDGFTLLYPEYWVQVRGSGAEVQFRSPLNGDENLFVAVSSPSSSKYTGVKDLGSPEQSGNVIKKQYVAEFMSTRLGVRRTAELLKASSKDVEEGKPYYQIEMSVKSEANSNQLAVTPEERVPFVEWDRRYITVQAVENKRLYELRLQIPSDIYARERPALQTVLDSFRTFPVEGFEGSK